jgi:hypothetical protein
MQVLDANGKVVMTYPGMINGTTNVDLSLLSKGVYHIQLEGDEFKLTRKVVKM